jgi:hypothetical protein
MALRWKKNPLPTGLSRIGCGPQGSTLRDGDIEYARVYGFRHDNKQKGWYWVTVNASDIPHMNTCADPVPDEAAAKAAAMAHVRKHLHSK